MQDHSTTRGAVPDGPDAITSSWLTAVLRASGVLTDAVVVASAWELISSQGWTTQMARLALTYDRPVADAPATLVVKLSAPEASTRTFFGRFYAREVAFYQRVAPTVSLRVPRCYYADYDAATLAHVLLLEDLTSAAAGDLSRGSSVEVALAYTRSIAALHAHWWEHERLDTLAEYFPPHGIPNYPYAQCWADYQAVLPLLFAQQVRFFASIQHWDATRRAWVEAITPRVVAALHDAAEAGLVGVG